MLEETIQLERLRQSIEAAENEAGNMSDYLDRGRPNDQEQKSAQARIARMNEEAKKLKTELHELIGKTPREGLEEWVNWHKGVLQGILLENETDTKTKTRIHVARTTLEEWDKVLRGEQEYVGINWYFLKDYKDRAAREFKKSSWKFWE